MTTAGVRLPHFEVRLLIKLELTKVQTEQSFDRVFLGDKSISEYFNSKS